MKRIRNGVVAIESVTTALNSEAASGRNELRRRRHREQHETEFAGLAEKKTEPDAETPSAAEQARQGAIRMVLVTITPAASPITSSGRAATSLRSSSIPTDRKTGPERSNGTARRRFPARAGRAIPRAHAGDECAERDRKCERVHQRRGADDCEKTGHDEQLALAEPADEAKQGVEDRSGRPATRAMTAQHRVERQLQARRSSRIGRHACHRGDDRDQRNDRQILEQQDRKGPLALRRVQLIVRSQHRQDLSGRGQG